MMMIVPDRLLVLNFDTITTIDGGNEDVMIFEDNKIRQIKSDSNGEGTYHFNYTCTYGTDGQLVSMINRGADGELYSERTVTYDSQGRITGQNNISYNSIMGTTSTESIAYIYNEDNTIKAEYSYEDASPDRTFHFNEVGLVNKITYGSGLVVQFAYSGNNIVSSSNNMNGQVDSFIYDELTSVKGEYLNIRRNQFSSYSNFVLYSQGVAPFEVKDKYIIKADYSGNDDPEYVYEFNEMGYPVKVQEVRPHSESERITIITYK